MKIPPSNIRQLDTAEQYVEAVCSHLARLLLQLEPLGPGEFERVPEYVANSGRLPMSSTFAVNLAICLPYLKGDASVPAVELPDLLQSVYEVVHGVEGCVMLERAVLDEHQRLANVPLDDAHQPMWVTE